MVKLFSDFINEDKNIINLSYYSFDWDDNILHMPTKVHMDHFIDNIWVPVDITTSKFAIVRTDKNWRLRNNDESEAYSELGDRGIRGKYVFIKDCKKAIFGRKYGPSWPVFIKCLSNGSIFSIITSRRHEPDSIRLTIEYIIDNILNEEQKFLLYSNCLKHSYLFREKGDFDRIPKGDVLSKSPLIKVYLDNCDFYGVTSPSFLKKYGNLGSPKNPEKLKEIALRNFLDKVKGFGKKIGANVSLGFSDDDTRNIEHIKKVFSNEESLKDVNFSIYDTNRNIKGGVKNRLLPNITETSNQAIGMESSIMPFTQFNNISSKFFPANNPNDSDTNREKSQLGVLKNLSDNIFKKKKKLKVKDIKKKRKLI